MTDGADPERAAGPVAGSVAESAASPGSDGGEAKAAFHLALRGRGVRDLAVLRAMERVSRESFVDDRYAALAARDLSVPISGGQTASPAWLIARMIEAARIEPNQRVLQIGAGSGYGTAILAQLGAAVIALERVRGLAERAEARLAALGLDATVLWADGSHGPAGGGDAFDRILVHGCCEASPDPLLDRLAAGGSLVCARPDATDQQIVKITAAAGAVALEGRRWQEQPVCRCRLPPLRAGLSGLR